MNENDRRAYTCNVESKLRNTSHMLSQRESKAYCQSLENRISICSIADVPAWVDQVALWHHHEWLRHEMGSQNDAEITRDVKDTSYALNLRTSNLKSHISGDDPIPVTFIAHDGEVPIGSLSLVRYQSSAFPISGVWLTNLYVEPEFREKGIASNLVVHALGYAKEHQVNDIWLYTFDKVRFYERLGWLNKGKQIISKKPCTVMTFSLPASAEVFALWK